MMVRSISLGVLFGQNSRYKRTYEGAMWGSLHLLTLNIFTFKFWICGLH